MQITSKPEELREILRNNIQARRRELGLTMVVASKRAGFTEAYWSQLEAGKRVPQFDKLAALASSLQTSPDALLSRDSFSKIALDTT